MPNEKRQPWMKWYPADWRDPRLRLCGLGARGLWADMIGYMHEGEPYGHLTIAGAPIGVAELAGLVGRPVQEVRRAVDELESRAVFSRTDDGIIYSRRMVRDKAKADADRANGKGGGNPKIKAPDNGGVNPQDNGGDKAQMLEARGQKESPPTPRKRGGLSADDLKAFEDWYAGYPHKVGRGAAERAWPAALAASSLGALKAAVARYRASKPADVPWCNPATWLNGKRWLDQPATDGAPESDQPTDAEREARLAKWTARLEEYRAGGAWQSTWGAEPWSGSTGILVPLGLRAAFVEARRPDPDDDVTKIPDFLRRTA